MRDDGGGVKNLSDIFVVVVKCYGKLWMFTNWFSSSSLDCSDDVSVEERVV